jgi:hypothetical protein
MRNSYKDFDRRPERKRHLGDIGGDGYEIFWEVSDLVCLAHDTKP